MGEYTNDLAELRWHYGSAYIIEHPSPDTWLAQRKDDRTTLRAGSAAGLLEKIRDDYRDRPVSRLDGRSAHSQSRDLLLHRGQLAPRDCSSFSARRTEPTCIADVILPACALRFAPVRSSGFRMPCHERAVELAGGRVAQVPASQAPARISIHAAARSKADQMTVLYVAIGVVIAVVWIAGGIFMQMGKDAEERRKRGTISPAEFCRRTRESLDRDDES